MLLSHCEAQLESYGLPFNLAIFNVFAREVVLYTFDIGGSYYMVSLCVFVSTRRVGDELCDELEM